MRLFIYTLIIITTLSCRRNNTAIPIKKTEKENTENLISSSEKPIKLGEDIDEINAYLKKIYSMNGKIYVDIDIVQIHYTNVDERKIINANPKIRTYEIDDKTLIYSNDCKTYKPFDLIKYKYALLKDKSIILVGKSVNGKMISINFGCYG